MHAPTRIAMAAAVAGLIASAVAVRADQAASKTAPRSEAIAAARTIMAASRYATLITLDGTGHPQSRIVDPFAPEDDLTIWVATNSRSRKVEQIAADARVTMTWFDAAGQSYVTLLGTAQAVRDPAEKARRWKPEWEKFYRDRNRGEDYLLIRVTPRRLEVVSERLGMVNDPATWRPVVVDLTPVRDGR